MPTIRVKVTGLENARHALNNLGEKISNPEVQLMRRLGETVLEDIDRRFQTRGYGEWPSLSEETIKRKGNDFVLVESGAMRSSSRITALVPGKVDVSVPYGGKTHNPDVPGYHQEGTGRMPRRRVVAVTSQLRQALRNTLNQWIEDMIRAFGKTM